MAKDKRIGELPGITASAAEGLSRIGVVTVQDLLAAEFDRVAYIVDDYNEAARLLREAKKVAESGSSRRSSRTNHAEPTVPSPLSPTSVPNAPRTAHRTGVQHAAHTNAPQPAAQTTAESAALTQAMSAMAQGLSLRGEYAERDRATLSRRLAAAATLVHDGAEEAELIVCAVLESVEGGAITADEVGPRFGKAVEDLLEECTALRAVPLLPTGKPPRYYLDMARNASREARRVCAAHLLAAMEEGTEALPGGSWHAKLLLEGLEAAGPDELVAAVRTAMNASRRAAA